MAEIVLSGVTKRFGSTLAVDEVSMTIGDGEFMVFVGPSGGGKSTTLRMIAGLETVSDGQIHIGPREVTRLQPKDRNVAMVFQNYALYAHKNVYDNLGFGLKVRGTPKEEIEQRVRRAADLLGIGELLERKPKQLSGGQMQRVALGRALVRDPEVFLLDEPLSNLDAKMRVRMREEIGKLHSATGTSMVYVTHDQIEAMTLGDRIAVMKDGRVQQIGRPLEIYDHPVNMFVANFIGSPEMNMIEGRLDSDAGGIRAVCDGFALALPERLLSRPPQSDRIVVGLRPEHLSPVGESEGTIAAEVSHVEQMGAQTLIFCRSGETALNALVNRDDHVRSGDRLWLSTSLPQVHLFDALDGESLLSASKAFEGEHPENSQREVTHG